jgi:hypothetical protein
VIIIYRAKVLLLEGRKPGVVELHQQKSRELKENNERYKELMYTGTVGCCIEGKRQNY